MNRGIINIIIRAIILLSIQVLILKPLSYVLGGYNYFNLFIYPLIFIILPIRTSKSAQLLIAFAVGLVVDIFYDSIGIHASASVFTMYLRPAILNWIVPRDGYRIKSSPVVEDYGLWWFVRFIAIALIFHLFFYYSVESFTFFYIKKIILSTLSSYSVSVIIIVLFTLIINPKE